MKLLITAFRPFGRRKNNTSEDTLLYLMKNGRRGQNLRLHFIVLPVNFRTAWPELQKAIRQFSPDALLMLGEKKGSTPCIEMKAHNVRRYKSGTIPIEKTGRNQLRTRLDAALLMSALQKRHSKWTISHNAGDYLCNFIYWKALARMPDLSSIFFHVPALSGENAQKEVENLATQTETLIGATKKQILRLNEKQSEQKQLTVPGQKAGSAKRKKGA